MLSAASLYLRTHRIWRLSTAISLAVLSVKALRDQLQAIAKASEQVKKLAPATEGLDNFARNEVSLKESLDKLDRLVADKLESDRVAANFMLRLGMLSNRVRAAGTEALPKISAESSSRAQIDALAAWTAAADQAIVIMLTTSNADTAVRLQPAAVRFRRRWKPATRRTRTFVIRIHPSDRSA